MGRRDRRAYPVTCTPGNPSQQKGSRRSKTAAAIAVMVLVAGCGSSPIQHAQHHVTRAAAAANRARHAAAVALNKAEKAAIATDTRAEKLTACHRITKALARAKPPVGEDQLAHNWRAACRTVGVTLTIP